jgi:hypothetical protein
LDFMNLPFSTSKFKNDISYINKFGMVCRWLNMYYSKIKIIIFFKVITISIWIILNNLIWICKECNVCHYWATIVCIHPTFGLGAKMHEWKPFTWSCLCRSPFDPRGKSCLRLINPNLPNGVFSMYRTNWDQILQLHQLSIKDHHNDSMYINTIHSCLN